MKRLKLLLIITIALAIAGCATIKKVTHQTDKYHNCISAVATCLEAYGGDEMNNMQDVATMIQYLNLLAPKYGLEIDWDESDVEKKQLSFKGDTTDEAINAFCLALQDFCDNQLE